MNREQLVSLLEHRRRMPLPPPSSSLRIVPHLLVKINHPLSRTLCSITSPECRFTSSPAPVPRRTTNGSLITVYVAEAFLAGLIFSARLNNNRPFARTPSQNFPRSSNRGNDYYNYRCVNRETRHRGVIVCCHS